MVLLSLPQENNTSLKELLITQQENDLLAFTSEQPLINQNDLINDSKYSEKISPFILMGKFMETKSIYKKKIVFRAKNNHRKITLIKNIKIIVCNNLFENNFCK